MRSSELVIISLLAGMIFLQYCDGRYRAAMPFATPAGQPVFAPSDIEFSYSVNHSVLDTDVSDVTDVTDVSDVTDVTDVSDAVRPKGVLPCDEDSCGAVVESPSDEDVDITAFVAGSDSPEIFQRIEGLEYQVFEIKKVSSPVRLCTDTSPQLPKQGM